MATEIVISGHTQIYTGEDLIGETDENNDISLRIFVPRKLIRTNLSGPEMYEKAINLGRRALIRIPFVKLDLTVLATFLAGEAASEGLIGDLGADVPFLPISIVPDNGDTFTFGFAQVIDNYDIEKWGYEAQKTMVMWEAIPDPTALDDPSTPLYTNP